MKFIIGYLLSRVIFKPGRSKNYEEYIEKQKFKSKYIGGKIDTNQIIKDLNRNLGHLKFNKDSMICLGARDGSEVRWFKNKGCLSIGIDLSSMSKTDVLEGNFENIDFPNGVFDIVYSNSLDHAFHPKKAIEESYRVLKKSGLAIFVIQLDPATFGFYEEVGWENAKEFNELFSKTGWSKTEYCKTFGTTYVGVFKKTKK